MAGRITIWTLWPVIWRLLIAAAILAAPIITFRAFTDEETSDPHRQQRLQENRETFQPRPRPADPLTRPTTSFNDRP